MKKLHEQYVQDPSSLTREQQNSLAEHARSVEAMVSYIPYTKESVAPTRWTEGYVKDPWQRPNNDPWQGPKADAVRRKQQEARETEKRSNSAPAEVSFNTS